MNHACFTPSDAEVLPPWAQASRVFGVAFGLWLIAGSAACSALVGIQDLPPATDEGGAGGNGGQGGPQKACQTATECSADQLCIASLCAASCTSDIDCPVNWACNPYYNAAGTQIGGSVCEPHCNPVAPTASDATHVGCGAGETCFAESISNYPPFTNCAAGITATVAEGSTCQSSLDCQVGATCITQTRDGGSVNFCANYCAVGAASSCGPGFTCVAFSTPIDDGAQEIGFCEASAGTNVAASQAAAAAASALCARFAACSPFLLEDVYGTTAACTTSLTAQTYDELMAPGVGYTASEAQACAGLLPSTSCDALFDNNLPASCRGTVGTLATGAACGDSSQCVTGFCSVASGVCGVCATPNNGGMACASDDDCAAGMVCNGATPRACVTPGSLHAACDATTLPCHSTLVCKGGQCATPDATGASCEVSSTSDVYGTCGSLTGNYCTATTTAAGVCKPFAFASASSPGCGYLNGTWPICGATGFCVGSTATVRGTCLAAAADGASCDDTNGPLCQPPSVCVAGSCTFPNAAACN